LLAAKQRATCDFVIERAGDKVEAIKHGFHSACERAGLADVPRIHRAYHRHPNASQWRADFGRPSRA